jgi:hypothetical protein
LAEAKEVEVTKAVEELLRSRATLHSSRVVVLQSNSLPLRVVRRLRGTSTTRMISRFKIEILV